MGFVVSLTEYPGDRPSTLTDRAEREYSRRFTAITSDKTTSELIIRADIRCPKCWEPYVAADGNADLGAWCYQVDCHSHPDDPTVWTIIARYSCKIARPDHWEIPNPLGRPSDIEFDSEEVMVPMEYDGDGIRVASTAEGRFDPPPERIEEWEVIRISKNVPLTLGPTFWRPFRNAVNSATWFGYPPGYVRCKRPKIVRGFENGIFFYKVSVEFVARPLPPLRGTVILWAKEWLGIAQVREPWDKVLLNQDYMERKRPQAEVGPCPTGSSYWLEVEADVIDPDCSGRFNGIYQMAYDSGCTWAGTGPGGGGTVSVTMDATNPNDAVLTIDPTGSTGGPVAEYRCATFSYGFGGVFLMTIEGAPDAYGGLCDFPESIAVWAGTYPDVTNGLINGRCGGDKFLRVPILDRRTAQPVSTPWPLSRDGTSLPLCADPVWLVHRVHPRMNFNLLPLP